MQGVARRAAGASQTGFYVELRVGQAGRSAVILAVSSLAGFGGMVIPFPVLMPYCVLGLFMGFTGVSILLLFNPQFLLPPPSAKRHAGGV